MKTKTIEEIIKYIQSEMKEIEKYNTSAEKAGAYRGTLKAVKDQLEKIK